MLTPVCKKQKELPNGHHDSTTNTTLAEKSKNTAFENKRSTFAKNSLKRVLLHKVSRKFLENFVIYQTSCGFLHAIGKEVSVKHKSDIYPVYQNI